MMSVSLSARLSPRARAQHGAARVPPRARTEQGNVTDPALAQGALVFPKPVKDFLPVHAFLHTTKAARIRRARQASMRRFNPLLGQRLHPARRQVHVDEQLHPLLSAISRSSALHAAYRSACVMSSRSR